MNTNSVESILLKKIKSQRLIIVVLALLLVISLFLFFFRSNLISLNLVPPFVGPVDDANASNGVKNYTLAAGGTKIAASRGAWFNISDINDYMTKTLPDIIKRQNDSHKPPKECDWKVGFYWKVQTDSLGVARLGFYVSPVLVNTLNKNEVYDYFDIKYTSYYVHPTSTNDCNVYNEGNLWP